MIAPSYGCPRDCGFDMSELATPSNRHNGLKLHVSQIDLLAFYARICPGQIAFTRIALLNRVDCSRVRCLLALLGVLPIVVLLGVLQLVNKIVCRIPWVDRIVFRPIGVDLDCLCFFVVAGAVSWVVMTLPPFQYHAELDSAGRRLVLFAPTSAGMG